MKGSDFKVDVVIITGTRRKMVDRWKKLIANLTWESLKMILIADNLCAWLHRNIIHNILNGISSSADMLLKNYLK